MVKNLHELMKKFKKEETCIEFLAKMRWPDKQYCPYCGHNKLYRIEDGKRFKCASRNCYKRFHVTVGTIFEASNIKLNKWLPALYIILSHKKGISSIQLGKDLGVTQKTAWFMLHRIREQLKENDSPLLSGTIEADETYMSRKYRSDFKGLSDAEVDHLLANNYSPRNKGVAMGMMNRETGKIRVQKFDEGTGKNVEKIIRDNVEPGSNLYTDESRLYNFLNKDYKRETVFHSGREWVRGDVHVNHVENFWSVMKRGVYGIYHQISYKHLQAYCDEFSYRYNTRKIKDGERFLVACSHLEGRLTYKQLVHGKGKETGEESQPDQKEG